MTAADRPYFARRWDELSPRMRQCIECAADGLPSKETARKLGISPLTVQTYRRDALSILGVHDMTHAVAVLMRAGVLR